MRFGFGRGWSKSPRNPIKTRKDFVQHFEDKKWPKIARIKGAKTGMDMISKLIPENRRK